MAAGLGAAMAFGPSARRLVPGLFAEGRQSSAVEVGEPQQMTALHRSGTLDMRLSRRTSALPERSSRLKATSTTSGSGFIPRKDNC